MKKSISILTTAVLLALSLSTAPLVASAQTTPKFDSPAAVAPKPVKKKVQAKHRAKAKATVKASGNTSVKKKVRKTKKTRKAKAL
jgi:hypothetical protein